MTCRFATFINTKRRTQPFLWFRLSYSAVLGNGKLAIDSVLYFYRVISLLGIFRDILNLTMLLNPRTYCTN